jgi:hypothetical protein
MTIDRDRMTIRAGENVPPRRGGSSKRLGMMLCVAGTLVLCFTTRFSPAQTAMELMRWKEFSYVKRISQLGGKMAGLHAIDRAGTVVLSDGGFAQLSSSMVHTNSPEGKAFCQGFVMYDFKDGSSILAKVDVSGEHDGKQIGTITFLSGTGRFKGISGRGTVSTWMPAEWDMYTEVEASYSVTAR